MIRLRIPILLICLIFIFHSCEKFKFPTSIFETSERAKYERQYSGSDSLLKDCQKEYAFAINNKLQIEDGFSVNVLIDENKRNALGYLIELKRGELLVIETLHPNFNGKIFTDIYDQSTGIDSSKSDLLQNGKFTKNVEQDGHYKIIIQPEIEYTGNFGLKIYTQASLKFPVAGKGNKDAQSFWGAERDGGSRSHEGVDIFASRGTPVVAAIDGFIIRTGNSGLGGKQVWLRDGIVGNSLYYAHLDSIMTTAGKKVKIGDTLGLVGNTGNAKGGATHLHFGIYSTGGAVDAYPFIKKRPISEYPKASSPKFKILKAGSNLRSGPGTQFEILKTFSEESAITILAADHEWFHIKTEDGTEGFVNLATLK